MSWPLIGLSLFATNVSSSSIIGLASSGYNTGISVFNYEWTGAIMLIIFAFFIVPFYLRYRLTTMPEYLKRRFDDRSSIYFSVLSIIMNVLIDIAGALYASSLFLRGIFPETDLFVFIIGMALVTGLYTTAGGLRAVIRTDAIQAGLLGLGAATVAISLFWNFDSWPEVRSTIQPEFLSLVRPIDDLMIPWPTLFISLPILGFYFMCSNQYMVQRVLSARSVDDGRKGAIFAAFLKLPLLFILVLPGTLGRLVYPDLANANLIFPELMFEFLPPGVLGLVLAGFVAALMSSIDSALTAVSSIATMDIYKRIKPDSSQKHLIRMGKIFILVAVLLASSWAPFIEQFPTLWEYLQAVLSYLSPPVVTCFLFGLFWKKASADGAFFSLLLGSLFASALIVNNYVFNIIDPIHYLYSATIIFLFSSVVMVVISLKYPDQTYFESYQVWKHANDTSAEATFQSWYKDYRLYGIAVCVCTGLLVVMFW